MSQQVFQNLGPIYITAEKYEAKRIAGTLEVGREYRIIDWEAQEKLISGVNIKSLNGASIVGEGNLTVQATLVSGTNIKTVNNNTLLGSGNIAVQPTLVSGTNIKTVNNTTLLGSGNIAVQPTLVSGTNIKTVNNESLLGSGNVSVITESDVNTKISEAFDTEIVFLDANGVETKVKVKAV